jgi:hypothetical protein
MGFADFLRDKEGVVQWVADNGRKYNCRLVHVPWDVDYEIFTDSKTKEERVEERHREWSAWDPEEACGYGRHRSVVINVNSVCGLKLNQRVLQCLAELTGTDDKGLLSSIPRDHPALVQVSLFFVFG